MRKHSNMKKLYFTLLMFLFVFSICLGSKISVKAENWMNITTHTNNKYQITLKWKKKAVTKYVIYRQTYNKKKGVWGKEKKIASISGKKTSYVNKRITKKKQYMYSLKAYKGKKLKYYGSIETCAGLGQCYWDDYFGIEGKISPKSIYLETSVYPGMKPDGFQIYRSFAGGKYKLIKTVKTKKYSMKYTDKTVKGGSSYKYKIRAYKIIKGKKIYGPYSVAIEKNAVNQTAQYGAQVISPKEDDNGMVSYIIVKLIPKNPYNGAFALNRRNGASLFFGDSTVHNYNGYDADEFTEGIDYYAYLRTSSYSFDGNSWTSLTDKTTIIPGNKTVFLKFEKNRFLYDETSRQETGEVSIEPFKYNPSDYEGAALSGFDATYNTYIPAFTSIDLKTGHTYMVFNSEAIH